MKNKRQAQKKAGTNGRPKALTAEQKLLESVQRFRALMNALPVGITFSTDTSCEYITGNPYLLKKLEMVHGDNISASSLDDNIAGRKLRHFINGKLVSGDQLPMQRAMALNRQTKPVEIEVELPSGKRWVHEAVGAPVHDENGNVVASVAVNVDLTERKRAEEADRMERFIEEEKKKIDFIADAAHELRTPLAIIKGNVDLAMRTGTHDAKAMEDTLQAIDNEVMHLDRLLSDLTLLTTKGSEFQRKMSSQKIQAKTLLDRLAKRHQSFAQKKRVTIHMGAMPLALVQGDERYLERLFSNIIANAISYGKEGGSVWIGGRKTKTHVSIDIKDDGIGISAKSLPHIFDRFYRAESSRSKDTGGTGLGLAIVKWIAEAHGGSVTAASEEGKGSTFTVTLPMVR